MSPSGAAGESFLSLTTASLIWVKAEIETRKIAIFRMLATELIVLMINVLFVCLGNICRSPTAEAIMNHLVAEAGLAEQIRCDSAGTSGTHDGESSDLRSIKHAYRRGYSMTSKSRKVDPEKDFVEFDFIIAMDKQNFRDLQQLQKHSLELQNKLFLMCDFCTQSPLQEVPDPYYLGADGFEQVIELLEDACRGLLEFLQKELAK